MQSLRSTRSHFGTDDRYLGYLAQFIKPCGYIGIVDIAFTREPRSIADKPQYLRAQYAKHWSYVHNVAWWKQHWAKTDLVEVEYADHLPESGDLLIDYVEGRPPQQDEDSIISARPFVRWCVSSDLRLQRRVSSV
jgi:hypothetical protein